MGDPAEQLLFGGVAVATRTGSSRHANLTRWAASFAAMVEQLCALDGLDAPAWVSRDEYRLRDPWFLLPGTAVRAWLLVSTPVPFKRRNIFSGDSSLVRV